MSANAPPPPLPAVNTWLAENLRLTAFTAAPTFDASSNWWETVTGFAPESAAVRRNRLEREDVGTFEGARLSLTVDPIRVQWIASAIMPEPPDAPDCLLNIGTFVDKRVQFQNLMKQWIDNCKVPISRLAFGAALVQPVNSTKEAYERLGQYLRRVDIVPGASDFMFRINKQISSKTPGDNVTINRITTWGAVVMRIATLGVNLADDRSPLSVAPSAEQPLTWFGCRVECDFNTSPDHQGPLPPDRLRELWIELTNEVLPFAEKGDDAL